jgi:hypothetical protein
LTGLQDELDKKDMRVKGLRFKTHIPAILFRFLMYSWNLSCQSCYPVEIYIMA